MRYTKICTIEVGMPNEAGHVHVLMRDEVAGAENVKAYKTMSAAKGAATRFENAMIHKYGDSVPNWSTDIFYRRDGWKYGEHKHPANL